MTRRPVLAVVAYPEIEAHDMATIEAIRERHDPRAPVIRAHFTLVFPTGAVRSGELSEHVREIADGQDEIDFELDRALVGPDADGCSANLFLVAGRGATEIMALHDALYGGALAPELRTDLPFVPHITVARGSDSDCADARLRAAALLPITGRIARLDIVEVIEDAVATIAVVDLRGG